MSVKFKKEDVLKIIAEEVNPDAARKIVQKLEEESKTKEPEEEKPKKEKSQWGIIIADSEGKLRGKELIGWIVKFPESHSPFKVEEKIRSTIHNFNATKKGRKMPVKTIGQACEVIPSKMFKEQELGVQTKVPVQAIALDNQI